MKSDELQTVLHEYSYLKSNFTLKSHPKNYGQKRTIKNNLKRLPFVYQKISFDI